MRQDVYDLFDDFINSEFLDKVMSARLLEFIGMVRSSIDALEDLNRRNDGLRKHEREDLEEDWLDLEALTSTYIYLSGDYELTQLPEWPSSEEPEEADHSAWTDYWSQGDLK